MIDYCHNYERGRLRIRTPYIYLNDQYAVLLEKAEKGLAGGNQHKMHAQEHMSAMGLNEVQPEVLQ